jgi:hypothetical protein
MAMHLCHSQRSGAADGKVYTFCAMPDVMTRHCGLQLWQQCYLADTARSSNSKCVELVRKLSHD